MEFRIKLVSGRYHIVEDANKKSVAYFTRSIYRKDVPFAMLTNRDGKDIALNLKEIESIEEEK